MHRAASWKVVDCARDLQNERALGRNASRILTQGHGIVLPVEHVPETLKHRLEPLALPRPCRQVQVAYGSRSGRALIRNRCRYRQ